MKLFYRRKFSYLLCLCFLSQQLMGAQGSNSLTTTTTQNVTSLKNSWELNTHLKEMGKSVLESVKDKKQNLELEQLFALYTATLKDPSFQLEKTYLKEEYKLNVLGMKSQFEINPLDADQIQINGIEFRIDPKLSLTQNAQRLEKTLRYNAGAEKLSFQESLYNLILPQAHAFDILTIALAVAAIAVIVIAISSYNKYQKSKDQKASSDAKLAESNRLYKEKEAKFKQLEGVHNGRCRASASEGTRVAGCEDWWYTEAI